MRTSSTRPVKQVLRTLELPRDLQLHLAVPLRQLVPRYKGGRLVPGPPVRKVAASDSFFVVDRTCKGSMVLIRGGMRGTLKRFVAWLMLRCKSFKAKLARFVPRDPKPIRAAAYMARRATMACARYRALCYVALRWALWCCPVLLLALVVAAFGYVVLRPVYWLVSTLFGFVVLLTQDKQGPRATFDLMATAFGMCCLLVGFSYGFVRVFVGRRRAYFMVWGTWPRR